jgi:hypothetical protein
MRCQTYAFVVTSAMLAACASQQQTVNNMQPQAVQAAEQRGRFELNCPEATAQVLSKEMIQTRETVVLANQPPERAEYTVGVKGCNKEQTYLVVCAQGGTGCVAAGSRESAATPAPAPPPQR